MTDELKKLKEAFDNEASIAPSEKARQAAIGNAMAAFDKKYGAQSQGMRLGHRLMSTATAVYETLIGRRSMKLTPALAGGASLGVLTLAVLSTGYFQTGLQDRKTDLDRLVERQILQGSRENRDEVDAGQYRKDFQDGRIAGRPAEKSESESQGASPVGRGSQLQVLPPSSPQSAPQGVFPSAPLTSMDQAAPIGGLSGVTGPAAIGEVSNFGVPAQNGASSVLPSPPSSSREYAARSDHKVRSELQKNRALGDKVARPNLALRSQAKQKGVGSDIVAPGYYQDQGRDKFAEITANPVKLVAEEPVSTFSIDVDTASYAFMRASLNNNVMPQKNAVRVEELINYFPYDYEPPEDRSEPFKSTVSVFPAPWNLDHKLIHIGIKGFDLKAAEKPHSNLVFLLDVSGSMNAPNKLPLMRNSMKLLLDGLKPDDTVAIVTYAGNAGTVLEPTAVKEKAKILAALDNLHAGGSTAGAEGIRQAYVLAEQGLDPEGVNRVILATDGDFNVGISNPEELKSFVERKRNSGVYLSVLGFGRGNYNDALMQTLAQNGNGNAAYIDSLNEARKVLVDEASSTLFTIAKDVKIQIEFNPQTVSEYRLIGYETRLLNREDFNNDKVDAGDIGSGHTVTAIYEITPKGSTAKLIDGLRYQPEAAKRAALGSSEEYAFLKLRYKLPDSTTSKLTTTPIDRGVEYDKVGGAPRDARFASSVAAFGQIMGGGKYTGSYSYDDVISLAQSAKGGDEFGYRAEFINLARLAKSAAALEAVK